jgi:hypothetical protein
VADALDAAGQPGVAADARALGAELAAAVSASLSPGRAAGATPSRPVDLGVVVNVDLFAPFGSVPVTHPAAGPTLDAIREVPSAHDAAVFDHDGPAGLSPRLTAQLATVEIEGGDPRAAARLDWLVEAAGPTVAWPGAIHPRTGAGSAGAPHDPVATARFLTAVRRLLVREAADGSGLALCSVVPPAWLGQSVDVRRAPTAFGLFSFSVRWHGERPALLWELEPHEGVDALTLTAPGLDPAWSGSGLSGDALLAAVPPPSAPSPSPSPSSGEAPAAAEGPEPAVAPVTIESPVRISPPPGQRGSFS